MPEEKDVIEQPVVTVPAPASEPARVIKMPEARVQAEEPAEEEEESFPIDEWQEELLRQIKRARAAVVLHTKYELIENVYPLMELLGEKVMEYITDMFERIEALEEAVFEEEGEGEVEAPAEAPAEVVSTEVSKVRPGTIEVQAVEQLTTKAAEIDVMFKKLDTVLPQEGEARTAYAELVQKMQDLAAQLVSSTPVKQ